MPEHGRTAATPFDHECAETTAAELRHDLAHSLSLLQATMPSQVTPGSLLQVALQETNRMDKEISHMLASLSAARVNFVSHSNLRNSLAMLTKQLSDSIDAISYRLNNLIISCRGNRSRVTGSISSLSVVQQPVERLALDLGHMDEFDWLDSTDILIQELKVRLILAC